MNRQASALTALVLATFSVCASGAEITTGVVSVFRENKGANTVGVDSGDVLDVAVRNVFPNLTTSGFSTNPQLPGTYPLVNLFTGTSGFFNRTLVTDLPGAGGVVTAPWTVTLQNGINTLLLPTNSMVGVQQLPLLTNLAVSGSALAPTLSWDTPTTGVLWSNVRLSIYNDRSNQLVVTEQLINGQLTSLNGTTSYAIPSGTLAPNANYTFRVFLEDPSGPSGTPLNRSATFVNHTTTSSAVSNGAVYVLVGGVTQPPLSTGANTYPLSNTAVGSGGRGAVTLQSGTTLTGTVVNVGPNNLGTLIVDNTTVTMNGGNFSDGVTTAPTGGFVTVGRVSGGRGYLDVINGGRIDINSSDNKPTPTDFLTPGLNIGRESGSFGNVNVDGAGSTIKITGPTIINATPLNNGVINVGRAGDGRLNILNGGQVLNAAAGETVIGRFAGSRGSVLVSGAGSTLDAGAQLNVGPNGGGEGMLRVENGGLVKAGATTVGAGGVLTGNGGTIQSNVTVNGGTFSPGSSPGKMTIVGDLFLTEGLLLLEANGGVPGQFDEVDVNGKIVIGPNMTIEILLGYTPTTPLSFMTASNGFLIDPDFEGPEIFALLGSGVQAGTMVQIAFGDTRYDVLVQAPVPAPATLALMAIGLVGLAAARRRGKLH